MLKRRPDIEYDSDELRTLIAMYRVIARIVNAIEVVNENKNFEEVVEEIIEKLKLIS